MSVIITHSRASSRVRVVLTSWGMQLIRDIGNGSIICCGCQKVIIKDDIDKHMETPCSYNHSDRQLGVGLIQRTKKRYDR